MKKLLIITAMVVLSLGLSAAVQNTAHDLSSGSTYTFNESNLQAANTDRICVFCHTPHQPTAVTTDPLWNHTLSSTATYGVYDSGTFDGSVANSGDIADIGGGTTTSNLCMSCHDGTVAVGSLYNDPNAVGGGETTPDNSGEPTDRIGQAANPALVGTNLTNDHPVNFTFDASLVTRDTTRRGGIVGLNDPTAAAIDNLLDASDKVQCTSCHNPHSSTYVAFLRINPAQSQLCTTCHNM